MAEVFTSDNSVSSEVMQSRAEEQAESLQIGQEIEAAHKAKLAGKYNSTEELESAYLELQKKLGDQTNVQEESEQVNETNWLDDAYRSINESGELSEEVSKQIQELNPLDVFNAMQSVNQQQQVQQNKDLSEREVNEIYKSVGGEEQYQNLIKWAQGSYTQAEIEAYDSLMESGNINQINFALQALSAKYTDAMGKDGEMLQGKPAASQSTFRSQQELIQAMNDPRYDNDPAYRNDVIEKLGRSEVQF